MAKKTQAQRDKEVEAAQAKLNGVKFELLRVVVQAQFLQRDDEGKIVGETSSEQMLFYGADAVAEWASTTLPASLKELNS